MLEGKEADASYVQRWTLYFTKEAATRESDAQTRRVKSFPIILNKPAKHDIATNKRKHYG